MSKLGIILLSLFIFVTVVLITHLAVQEMMSGKYIFAGISFLLAGINVWNLRSVLCRYTKSTVA